MKRMLLLLFATLLLLGSLFACDKKDKMVYPDNAPVIYDSYDEYLTFLERASPLPVWFVYYENISFVGEYVDFQDIYYQRKPFCTKVIYTLNDAFGSFKLYCDHWSLYDENFEEYEGVQYKKDDEKITHVAWVYKGTEFTVYKLEDYPTDATDTFVSRLLDPDTVDAAVAEFNLRVKGY